MALLGSALAAVAIGYLLATSYLVFRDDLLGATAARQARMQQAYEDRISALRAQVDRITSRQLLDQQLMESKVSELIARQSQLTLRHGRIGPMLERANTAAGALPAIAPLPEQKPDTSAALASPATLTTAYAPEAELRATSASAFAFWSPRAAITAESEADHADKIFVTINQSLRTIENEQITRIDALAENAYQTADTIRDALQTAGLSVDVDFDKDEATGGPLISADKASMFETKVKELDQALDALDQVKDKARKLPISNPAPGLAITSTYGVRRDPLLGIPALHSGMDFRAPTGTAVRVTASGTVTKAGSNGGYGNMVEVDHGNGFSTRYAHLSRVRVSIGDSVETYAVIGDSGSTGRSTGPHLHYEVRHNGDPVDPLRFLKAGKKVVKFL
ncbi:peptidoglycan DD-metalloendopeptidase family protein [Mesorhizobium sp. NBSH29]|nr:peptidoglycan DD-metalloendopeptidase family protein [Mesorhizobium sp. NBSH29]